MLSIITFTMTKPNPWCQNMYWLYDIAIILLRHKRLGLEYLRFVAAQHGHRGRPLTRAMISLWRMVAMEFGMCRSGRNGGSSGSITVGYGKLRAQRGGTRS